MRQVRADVSHRIRRPASVFAAWWFRGVLAGGIAVLVLLLVGPWIVGWSGTELPHSLRRVLPWGGGDERAAATGPSAAPAPPAPAPAGGPGESAARPPEALPGAMTAAPRAGEASASVAASADPVPAPAPAAPDGTVPRPAPKGAPAPGPHPGAGLTAPPPAYWVQVGAFLDHRNADRLVERLRREGHPATTTVFEQSRVAYRVLLTGSDGVAPPPDLVERAQGLGIPVESTPEGPAVEGLVPLRRAVELSHALRQQGIRVRLKQEVGSSTFRVVRVGSFATSAEAEAARASLAAQGVDGIVVRER
jgi:cell division septation protein DedD